MPYTQRPYRLTARLCVVLQTRYRHPHVLGVFIVATFIARTRHMGGCCKDKRRTRPCFVVDEVRSSSRSSRDQMTTIIKRLCPPKFTNIGQQSKQPYYVRRLRGPLIPGTIDDVHGLVVAYLSQLYIYISNIIPELIKNDAKLRWKAGETRLTQTRQIPPFPKSPNHR